MKRLPILRAMASPAGLAARADDGAAAADTVSADGDVMVVRFSVFNVWYEIDSWWEGRFLERTVPGAFAKTIAERGDRVKVLFNHGYDFQVGDKILGVPSLIEENADGPYMEVPLLDTSYNRDLIPGLRAGGYGSSFMFSVVREEWNREPDKSDYNPEGLPERTIKEVALYEAGPVTWPASEAATAGMRSMTDWYGERLAERDPSTRAALAQRFDNFRAEHGLRTPADRAGAASPSTDAPGADERAHPTGLTPHLRARRLALLDV